MTLERFTAEEYRKDRMADFFVRAENGWMTHERLAEHMLEVLEVTPFRSYEIILGKMHAMCPTQQDLDRFARTMAQGIGAMMGLEGYRSGGTDGEPAQQ